MKMRLIAAAVLIPVLLVILLLAPAMVIAILLGIVCAIGAYELMAATAGIKHLRLLAYTMLMAFLLPLWCFGGMVHWQALAGVLAFAALLFGEVLLSHGKLEFNKLSVCLAAGLLIPYLLSALIRIVGDGSNRALLFIPFILAFASDSGAYFVGCAWGRHKLAPVISPKKSVEGMLGGVVADIVAMVLYCLIMDLAFDAAANYLYAITYGILGSLAGTFGDLCFSAIKRQAKIKDYGNLIPGHGGILDRFDSVVIVAPLTELLLVLLPVLE